MGTPESRIPAVSPLLTDAYQLGMAQSYFEQGMHQTAVFEFFVRKLPRNRRFFVAAGLETVLQYLEDLNFSKQDVDWLRKTGAYSAEFLQYLRKLRFTGHVDAMPEGMVFFENEPIFRVTAPIDQAQIIESRVINLLHFQTLIASKAVLSTLPTLGTDKRLVDFGMRRAHGAEAALLAARSAYIGGFHGTSNVMAGQLFGIPLYGTLAHSYIEAHASECEALHHFAKTVKNVTLLIDTYDTENAARAIVSALPEWRREGLSVGGVRIDSGDLLEHSRRVRQIFDEAGFFDLKIFVSGGLDETDVHSLIEAKAPIDGFGIGTQLVVSGDAPALDCAYKLEEYAGIPRRKISEGKATWPGIKQVYRHFDAQGRIDYDFLSLDDEQDSGKPLLQPVMRSGKRLLAPKPLNAIRTEVLERLRRLPPELRSTHRAPAERVEISPGLRTLTEKMERERWSGACNSDQNNDSQARSRNHDTHRRSRSSG